MSSRSANGSIHIAGLWKILCAFAIMSGHLSVTLKELHPHSTAWPAVLLFLRFFGSRHFFFFSGFFAARGLFDDTKPLGRLSAIRFARIYILVVASLSLGVASKFILLSSGVPEASHPWPANLWQGPIDWRSALVHLIPTGFASTNDYNYAIWYLYHELRLIALFPLFRWALRGGALRISVVILGLLATAGIGEHLFFGYFPLFRTSPFQTLGYGFIFLVGAATWRIMRHLERMEIRPSRAAAWSILAIGIAIGYLEAFGIQPPFHSPPLLNIQTALGQMLVFLGLSFLLPHLSTPAWLNRATHWSVGIYVLHPPIHQLLTHVVAHSGKEWLLVLTPVLSVPLGALFYHGFVVPIGNRISRVGKPLP